MPAELAARCRQLYRWYGTDAELIDIKRPVEQQVTHLPWAGEAAEKEYLDFARMVDDRIDQDPALRPFLARAAETSIRLATIRAAGRDFCDAAVTVEDVHWGAGIAWNAGLQLYLGARGVTPMTERGKWIERLINYVRARNLIGKPATVRTFQQHIRCKLKAAEVREMVAQLVQIGLAATGGRWNFGLSSRSRPKIDCVYCMRTCNYEIAYKGNSYLCPFYLYK